MNYVKTPFSILLTAILTLFFAVSCGGGKKKETVEAPENPPKEKPKDPSVEPEKKTPKNTDPAPPTPVGDTLKKLVSKSADLLAKADEVGASKVLLELKPTEYGAALDMCGELEGYEDTVVVELTEAILSLWAKSDPATATEFALSLEGDARVAAAMLVFEAWGSQNPKAALEWYGNAIESGDKSVGNDVLAPVFTKWAKHDASSAFAAAVELSPDRKNAVLLGMTEVVTDTGARPSYLRELVKMTPDALRTQVMAKAAERWAQAGEGQKAVEWLDTLDADSDRVYAQDKAMNSWVASNPEEAISFLMYREAGDSRTRMMRDALEQWARQDRPAATKWFNGVGEGGFGMDESDVQKLRDRLEP